MFRIAIGENADPHTTLDESKEVEWIDIRGSAAEIPEGQSISLVRIRLMGW